VDGIGRSTTRVHYNAKGMLVKSENAAKPMADAAGPLVEWLRGRPVMESALDYGCGKLRYTPYVAARSRYLGLVDSSEQLDRVQRIDGVETTVRQYAKEKWPGCRIYELTEFWKGVSHTYDFILCANVLSAIPCPKVRARSLRSLRRGLTPRGTVLVVNQHTNSYFKEASSRPEAIAHLDGWLLPSRGGASYYGILTKDKVVELLKRHGFVIAQTWIDGQSNYVLAGRGGA
jgi:hypothetical protein